jgi:NAD(P)-dependent dehydrogenase (short-subunit alcohol dehydrogenase family)
MKDLRGKNALVTGAASGIGRALSLALAREGMTLFLVDLDTAGMATLATEIEGVGGRAFTARCNVARYDEVLALADDAQARMGPVDLLVNNAGIGGAGLVEELEPEAWQQVFDVNTWSIVYAVRAFLPAMIARGTGHIVNTGSGAGIVGIPYHIQYVVSKFAVVGLTEALYSEIKHAHPGIDISVICPSYLNTRIIDRTDIQLPAKLVSGIDADALRGARGGVQDAFLGALQPKQHQSGQGRGQVCRRHQAESALYL